MINKERRERKKRQRHMTSGSGLFDTVPSGMSFEQQMQLAMKQSERDAQRQERRATELEDARVQFCQVTAQSSFGAYGETPTQNFLYESAEDNSNESSRESEKEFDDAPPVSEEVVGEFVIEEAADIMELGGFSIMAASAPVFSRKGVEVAD
jgi:hypothetical protein